MKKYPLVIALSAALLAPVATLAQSWYVGGGLGDSELDRWDDSDTSLRLLGGYRLSDRFAVELSYTDYGDFSRGAGRADVEAVTLSAVGTLPLNAQWGLFARGGVARTDANLHVGAAHGSDDDFSVAVALGVNWRVAPRVELRAEYEILDDVSFANARDSDIDTLGIGATYSF